MLARARKAYGVIAAFQVAGAFALSKLLLHENAPLWTTCLLSLLIMLAATFGTLIPLPLIHLFFIVLLIVAHPASPQVVLLLWILTGITCGSSMILMVHTMPRKLLRPAVIAVKAVQDVWPSAIDESLLFRLFGHPGAIVFTVMSELLIAPIAIVNVIGVGIMYRKGIQYDDLAHHAMSNSKQPCTSSIYKDADTETEKNSVQPAHQPTGPLLVWVHGNGHNEAQWLLSRALTEAHLPHYNHFAVNFFKGSVLTEPHAESMSVADCSAFALKQIVQHVIKHDLDPSHVVVVGHSLGGVIAAYITENLLAADGSLVGTDTSGTTGTGAEDVKLRVRRVIAISAPFDGSHILEWAMRVIGPRWLPKYQYGIFRDFRNNSHTELLGRMEKSQLSGRVSYHAMSGAADPLVHPKSALPAFIPDRLTLPHLAHYNIMVSMPLWNAVISRIALKVD